MGRTTGIGVVRKGRRISVTASTIAAMVGLGRMIGGHRVGLVGRRTATNSPQSER